MSWDPQHGDPTLCKPKRKVGRSMEDNGPRVGREVLPRLLRPGRRTTGAQTEDGDLRRAPTRAWGARPRALRDEERPGASGALLLAEDRRRFSCDQVGGRRALNKLRTATARAPSPRGVLP